MNSYSYRNRLVGCFGFSGPLRQYFSLYRAVSQREEEREERIEESKNVQTNPTRTYCKRNRPLPYHHPNCRTPRHWKFTQDHRTTRPTPTEIGRQGRVSACIRGGVGVVSAYCKVHWSGEKPCPLNYIIFSNNSSVLWAYRSFETVFQFITGRLPERGRKKRQMIDKRKMSKQPHRTCCKRSRSLPYYNSN